MVARPSHSLPLVLHRLLAVIIVVFWLTMNALLVRNELNPSGSRVREVPLHHVLKLLYLHDERSDLRIFSDGRYLGSLHLHPRIDGARRLLDFNGTVNVQFAPESRQRFSWDGQLELENTFAFHRVNLGLSLHDDALTRVEVEIPAGSGRARATFKQRGSIISTHEFSSDQAGARQLFGQVGGDPALLSAFAAPSATADWQVRARQSSFPIKNERVDTYLVTIEQSGQTLAEIHIDQLGSVLHAKTLLGYTFAPDDVAP